MSVTQKQFKYKTRIRREDEKRRKIQYQKGKQKIIKREE
jgi:hypothetical protein